jgi:tetratricopeptide repeat protein 21B
MNPDYVTTLVKEYLLYVPTDPVSHGQAVSPALKRTLMILEPVTKACPGLRDAQFLVAKAKYLSGDSKSAVSTLHHVLDNLDPTFAEAHLLMAQVQLQMGNFLNAQQSLEVGLSYNFEVREHPIYHLINAKVQKEQGEIKEAIGTLQTAMNLVNKEKNGAKKPGSSSKRIEFSRNDRISLYLELSDCYRLSGQNQEATRVMQEAMTEYQGTGEEVRITVANADLALEKGDTETALNILRTVGPEQPYFIQAKEKMAQIYLNHR